MEKQLLKRISSLEKRVVDLYHKLKQQLVGPQGPQGVQGPQGPQGAVGPVGPAGLEWQGLWNENTSYVEDDAVGYAGASWFCISAVTGTNNDSPDNDTEHWALLAAQGAQGQDGAPGAQGPMGPQGPAGPQGTAPVKTRGVVYGDSQSYFTQTVLPYDINTVLDGAESSSFKLPNTTIIGKEIIVDVMGANCRFYGFNGGLAFETAVNGSSSQITSAFNDLIKFTSIGGNYWLVEYLPRVYPTLNGKKLTDQSGVYTFTTNNTTSPLSLSTLNASYPNSTTIYDFKVFCPNIAGGGLVYIKTGVSTWVSQPITTVT